MWRRPGKISWFGSRSGQYSTDPTPGPFVNPTLDIGSAVAVVASSPFAGGGNSYQFSSSVNSYIDTAASADWAPGTGDFTIEWFGNQSTLAGFQRVFTVDDFASIDIGVSIESGTFYYWANDTFRYNSSSASTINTWIHWAVVRSSGVTRVYKNGTQLGSQVSDTNNITNTTDPLTIGNENTASTLAAYVGLLTNFRWIDGLAVYTGNFTVPTTALTATAGANPYGGSNTAAIPAGVTKLLLVP
jgi:Concanavalin A-like lectin/glucanases superfamily